MFYSSGAAASGIKTHLFPSVLKCIIVIVTPPPKGLHHSATSILQSINLQRKPLVFVSIVQDGASLTIADGARYLRL